MPSLLELRRSEKTLMNSVLIKRLRNLLTSATFPTKPIIFRRSSSLSLKHCNKIMVNAHSDIVKNKFQFFLLTLKHPKKNSIPLPSKNRSQLIAVSSVTFHIVDQATSITSSNTFRVKRSYINVNIVCNK